MSAPWDTVAAIARTPPGFHPFRTHDATPLGLGIVERLPTQGGSLCSQPWAVRCDPFGVIVADGASLLLRYFPLTLNTSLQRGDIKAAFDLAADASLIRCTACEIIIDLIAILQ